MGGRDEMASASGKRFAVDPRLIPVSKEATAVCSAFGLDPVATMGEGALLLTCASRASSEVTRLLLGWGIPATRIGKVQEGPGTVTFSGPGGTRRRRSGRDPYWSAYEVAAKRGLR